MIRKWKSANVDNKRENNTNAERQRKGQGSKLLQTYYLPAFGLEITDRCNCGEIHGFLDTNLLLTKNKKDAGENLGEQMIYCLLIKKKVKMKQNLSYRL